MNAVGGTATGRDGPPRVLVLRALGLGDLLTAVPALRALRGRYPEAVITLAAPAALAPIAALADLPGDADGEAGAGRVVDEVADTAPLSALAPSLHHAHLAVNLHGRGPESTRLLLAASPRRLVTFAHAGLPLTRRSPRWRPDEHETARWCRLLTESGIPADPGRLELRSPDVPSPAPGAAVVHPGAGAPARRWPPGRWAAVARALRAAGHDVVVTGSDGEVPLAERVADEAGLAPGSVLAGRTGLAGLAALAADASLVLSGDTGMAHLAAAYRRPAVTLAGPVPPRLWGPPPRPWHVTLWAGRHTPTEPAGDPHGIRPDPRLLEISVADTLEAARAVLAGAPLSQVSATSRRVERRTMRASSAEPGC